MNRFHRARYNHSTAATGATRSLTVANGYGNAGEPSETALRAVSPLGDFSMIGVILFLSHVMLDLQSQPVNRCTCLEARLNHLWCEACKVGYVAGVRIPSHVLYEALDAHGHVIDIKTVTCPTCRRALETDGYCESCRAGFFHKQLYCTSITYRLAKGRVTPPEVLSCPTCRMNAESQGWCEACGVGMIGLTAYHDREQFQATLAEYRLLLEAIDKLKSCDICATAMIFDSYCPIHDATYKNGKRVQTKAPDSK